MSQGSNHWFTITTKQQTTNNKTTKQTTTKHKNTNSIVKTNYTELTDEQRDIFIEAEKKGFRTEISDEAFETLQLHGGWESNANWNTEVYGGLSEDNLRKEGEELGRIAARCYEESLSAEEA